VSNSTKRKAERGMRKNNKRKCVCACSIIACLLWATNVCGAGKIIIDPKIYFGVKNNSNFWKSAQNKASVNTYYVKPGIVFGYVTPKVDISFDGTLDAFWYDDQDDQQSGVRAAEDDNYVGATVESKANFQVTDRLNLGLKDDFYVTRDPARSDGNSNSIARDKYAINYFEPNMYYEFADKFGLMSKYRNTYTDYEKNLEDSAENRGIFDLFYNLNRSAAVYVDYQVWKREYDQDSSDYTSNMVSLNYEHQFNYYTIKGGGGYHNRTFDSDNIDDLDLFSWKIQLKGQDADTNRRTTRSYLALDVGQEMNDDGTGDSYFTATYLRFEGAYRFFDKLETTVKAAYQNSDYHTDPRDEDTYYSSLYLGYNIFNYFTLGIEGGFESRDSNIVGNDYDDLFVMFLLNVDYSLSSR